MAKDLLSAAASVCRNLPEYHLADYFSPGSRPLSSSGSGALGCNERPLFSWHRDERSVHPYRPSFEGFVRLRVALCTLEEACRDDGTTVVTFEPETIPAVEALVEVLGTRRRNRAAEAHADSNPLQQAASIAQFF